MLLYSNTQLERACPGRGLLSLIVAGFAHGLQQSLLPAVAYARNLKTHHFPILSSGFQQLHLPAEIHIQPRAVFLFLKNKPLYRPYSSVSNGIATQATPFYTIELLQKRLITEHLLFLRLRYRQGQNMHLIDFGWRQAKNPLLVRGFASLDPIRVACIQSIGAAVPPPLQRQKPLNMNQK